MYRIKISVLAVIVAAMIIHLYSLGNKSIVSSISYSGSIEMIERSQPVNNVGGLKFPSSGENRYIYVFLAEGDELNYRRYDIGKGKTTDINVPKNKNFFICTESSPSSENAWSWHSDFIDIKLKGKVAKLVNQGEVTSYTPVSKELKGERYYNSYFQFFGENTGTEKISLVYGNQIKDYLKIPININVE